MVTLINQNLGLDNLKTINILIYHTYIYVTIFPHL